ncbi:energy-coupling factor transporter transmembrane component T [Terrilactibacillus sp. S3-3]|nr:energy-coupling factor transporter transmembrane component T [Terrilactibacillus sp. S3-3]
MGFSRFHPLILFLYYFGAIILLIKADQIFFLCCSLFLLIILEIIQDRAVSFKRWLGGYLFFFLLILVLTPLFNHRGARILGYFLGKPVMLEACLQGCAIGLSLINILVLFLSYHRLATADKYIAVIGSIVPKISMMLMIVFRFVPLFIRRYGDIQTAQRAKGVSIGEGHVFRRVKYGLIFIQTLLTFSLEEALQTADSMEARGYGYSDKRTFYERGHWYVRDTMVFLFLGALIAVFFPP